MLDAVINLFAALGLSSSAGLNAYLPMLILSLSARFFPGLIKLSEPYDVLTSGWVIGVLVVLLIVEFFADKVPAVNHINDIIQTIIRPAAGALLFAANMGEMNPVLAMVLGVIVAGGVHATKSVAVRPAVTATTGGVANPIVSIIEDILAAVVSILSILLPVLIAAFVVLALIMLVWWLVRRQQRRAIRAISNE